MLSGVLRLCKHLARAAREKRPKTGGILVPHSGHIPAGISVRGAFVGSRLSPCPAEITIG